MDKRYQVFLSSTFVDLEDERKEVMSALQKAGFFVAGMELFPSDDDESWEVIKRVIDQSDYYVLVVAGRYGSISKDGKSFTEMEYDYAKEQGLPVLPFLHKDPSSLSIKNTEKVNPDKLEVFKKKIEKLHTKRAWQSKHELATEVLASLSQTVNLRPRTGWVRGTVADTNVELSALLQDLQIKFERLREDRDAIANRLDQIGEGTTLSDIAWGNDEVNLAYEITEKQHQGGEKQKHSREISISWDLIFHVIAPKCIGWQYLSKIEQALVRELLNEEPGYSSSFPEESLDVIRTQLLAVNLIHIETEQNESYRFRSVVELWRLTDKGLREYSVAKAIRKQSGN